MKEPWVLFLWVGLGCQPLQAQPAQPPLLDPVVVTAERQQRSSFDTPAAISAVTREVIEQGGPQVNLSEALNRVPGITALNRQNYAQDLQLSIRGFGARSTFGIRGVRLIVDGIPATMPDGQGQASSIALGSAGRIEVLRGPLAQLYGNSAGGVVQVWTEDDALQPTVTGTVAAGPYHLARVGTTFSTSDEDTGLTLEASHFETDGYRDHSAAERNQFNGRWQTQRGPTHVSIVVNALDQPLAQDPGGLTWADFQAQPRKAADAAVAQDARKTVRQQQLGIVVDHELNSANTLTMRLYGGQRSLDNALSIPYAPQLSDTSSGGIVSFERAYGGFGLQLSHRSEWAGMPMRWVAGIEGDRMNEDRQGYINQNGVQGDLKRDERNRVESRDAFAQASLDLSSQWNIMAGVRTSQVRFTSEDRFIAAGNPDDSGGVDYSATNPVLGISWYATPALHVYLNAGRGFETPTLNELSYRNAGSGLNTELRAAHARHAELGAKWKLTPEHRVDVAVFHIRTEDEIVVDTSAGGRSTYRNANETERRGVELAWAGQWNDVWRTHLSLTTLQARFEDTGKQLPGAPPRSAFAELAWSPRAAWGGFNAAAEWVYTGRLYANDPNSDYAPSASVFNLRAGFAQSRGAWRFSQLLRVDNLADRQYAGSVIVNDANRRYFESALPRNWLLSATARCEF